MRGRHGSNDFLKGPLPQNMEGRHGCVCGGTLSIFFSSIWSLIEVSSMILSYGVGPVSNNKNLNLGRTRF